MAKRFIGQKRSIFCQRELISFHDKMYLHNIPGTISIKVIENKIVLYTTNDLNDSNSKGC